MPLLRKIVFYAFLLAYLLGCPPVILHVLGYGVQPGASQGLVKTGLLSLATVPPGASIYVGGRRYLKRTPAVLEGLYPGEYHVKALLKSHHPWSRTVRVEAGKATSIEKVLLLPTRHVARTLWPEPVKELLPIPETRFLVLTMGPTAGDALVYDREARAGWPLMPRGSPYRNSRVVSSVLVRGSPLLLLRLRARGGDRYLGASLRGGHAQLADLTKLFPAAPQWVTWDPRWPQQLFSVQDGSVSRLDLETAAIYPKLIEQVRGVGVSDQKLYVLTDDLALRRIDQDGRRLTTFLDDPRARAALSRTRGLFRITVLPGGLLVLSGERGELWVSRFPGEVIDAGIRGFVVDPHHEQLLIWRKDRIGILDCSAEARADRVAASRPHPRWMAEERGDIRQGFWVYDASHVLFQDGDTVFLLEREPPGAPASLVRVRAGSAIAYSEESGGLYYLDRSTGRLSFLEILPNNR